MTALAPQPLTGPAGPCDRILSWPKVREITDLSRSTAWRRQREGDFPGPVRISPGRVGWWESQVNAWVASRRPSAPADAASGPPPSRPPVVATVEPALPVPSRPTITAHAAPAPAPAARRRPARHAPGAAAQIAFDF